MEMCVLVHFYAAVSIMITICLCCRLQLYTYECTFHAYVIPARRCLPGLYLCVCVFLRGLRLSMQWRQLASRLKVDICELHFDFPTVSWHFDLFEYLGARVSIFVQILDLLCFEAYCVLLPHIDICRRSHFCIALQQYKLSGCHKMYVVFVP